MKFKKALLGCLSAAMVLSGIPVGGFGVSEVTAAEQTGTGNHLIQKKTVQEIDAATLLAHAKANSQQTNPPGKGGPAAWAFDTQDHWWHSRFEGIPGDGEVTSGIPSETNPIWIQTGFDEEKAIKKLTYRGRTDDKGGIINKYQVQIANVTGREPEDTDFSKVKEGNLANNMNEQTIMLDRAVQATHIRLVVYSVHAKTGFGNHVAAKQIRVYEEVNAEGFYDTNHHKDYWDYEVYNGTLGQQTDDDIWHYQIKTNGTWSDLPNAAFHGTYWMNQSSSSGTDTTYFYARLGKDRINSYLNESRQQQALAFAWKAQEAGYYRATLEANVTSEANKKLECRVWHATAGSTGDGTVLHTGLLEPNTKFTSKIAKAAAGDFIRIGALRKEAFAQNFYPVIEKVTVKDYAQQYLDEVDGFEDRDTFTEASKAAVVAARTALTEAVQAAEPDMALIEERLTALETAIADLEVYVAVTGINLNKETLSLEIGATETLTATVTPDNATDKEVIWNSDKADVAAVNENTGEVTANKVGTAKITVYSTKYPEIKAECIVTVTRNDTALDTAIREAETKMAESGYEDQYTEASKAALAEALENAKAAKEDLQMLPGEVELVVQELQAAISGLELKAVVTIEINGQTETKYCEVGEQVKVTAAAAPEGQKFSHWAVEGKPICYYDSYTFTVYGDTTVTAVYIEDSKPVEKAVSVLCSVSYQDGKVKFLSKHSVPADAGYKVLRTGVVATDSTGYAEIGSEEGLTLDTTATARLKKYGVDTNYYLANFTQYLKTSRATTWYARGYVTYQDAEGTQHTVYSDMATYTVK